MDYISAMNPKDIIILKGTNPIEIMENGSPETYTYVNLQFSFLA
jgi:hypothetical protein